MEHDRHQILVEEATESYARVVVEPLERGYGITLGNALRRVLLSSIAGAAISAVRIEGVLHEFSTIPGVREDVIELLMNLKTVPVRSWSSDVKTLRVEVEGPKVVTAADISPDSEVEFVDPDVPLCTLEAGRTLQMDLYVESGTGYAAIDRARPPYLPIDALMIDAIFSPVRRVKYEVQDKRMGQRTDYDRLVLEIETNGVIAPVQAVAQAAALLSRYFGSVASALSVREESPAVREGEDASGPEVASDVPAFPIIPGVEQSVLARPVRDLELSVRSENCLLRGGVHLIGDLVGRSKDDLLKIRNLGKISLREIEEKLVNFGLALGGGSSSEGEEPEDGEGEGSEPSEEPRLSLVPQETEEVADLDDVTPSDPEPDSPAQPGALEAEAKEE